MEAPIKPYNKTELTELYQISFNVLKIWLKPFSEEIGEYKGKLYTVNQIKIIFEKLGRPEID